MAPRVISRYGSEQYRVESGKMLAVSYLFLKGTPFIYQGQEIGMTNWYPERTGMYEDVQTRNQLQAGRRVPPYNPKKVAEAIAWGSMTQEMQ